MGRRLPYLTEGAWVPGQTNWLVLILQLVLTVQAASRGMDYVQPRPPRPLPPSLSVIEAALPMAVWGSVLLVCAALVFAGLFGGWVWPIVAGHISLAGLYGAFAYGLLAQTPIRSGWLSFIGVALLAPGLLLGVSRWQSWRWVRFTLAMGMVLAGGWIAAYGLGYDFRNGTGLFIAGISHSTFAIGVAYIAYRRPPAVVR